MVILKTGEQFVDKFMEKTGKFVRFDRYGKVERGRIKSFTIYKTR